MIEQKFFPLAVKPEPNGFSKDPGIPASKPDSPLLGRLLCSGPASVFLGEMSDGSNQIAKLNFTGPPGSATGIYFSLVPFLENNGFKVRKVDESISVTPEHQQYYGMVVEQKRQLEGVIKSGLASAAQAVADASLVEHDLRKYREILNYFKEGVSVGEKKGSEHSLRAMFIDQVDMHTGDGVSLRSIVQRWPTIIADFMKLTDKNDTIEKVENALKGISKAESVILTTKNKLFIEWENMFRTAAIERYSQLKSMSDSRKKTVDEYRNWLKPYIARFKAMKLGHEGMEGIFASAKTPYELAGQASFYNAIKLWVWKAYMPAEFRKPSTESTYTIPINDKFVVDNFIKNKEKGLASIYENLNNKTEKKDKKTEEVTESNLADDMIKEIIDKKFWNAENGLDKNSHYYVFFEIEIERLGGKTPGYEFEDITFLVKAYMISQNVMLVKQLELKLREKEIEKYFNQILGLGNEKAFEKEYPELAGKEEGKKEHEIKFDFGVGKVWKEYAKGAGDFFKKTDAFFGGIEKGAGKLLSGLNLPLLFFKQGPYARDFNDVIAKFFMAPMGQDYFGPVKGFITDKMGVG
ncbi:MAG: hypothetical protein KKB25_03200 [Nanoarchaeota archaeon]|nr:hypothetical protein [Nanoarchaeota archaeon]